MPLPADWGDGNIAGNKKQCIWPRRHHLALCLSNVGGGTNHGELKWNFTTVLECCSLKRQQQHYNWYDAARNYANVVIISYVYILDIRDRLSSASSNIICDSHWINECHNAQIFISQSNGDSHTASIQWTQETMKFECFVLGAVFLCSSNYLLLSLIVVASV